MAHSLKRMALTAMALTAILSQLGAAQAQTGYSYLFWPYFTAAPAPSQVRVPAQQAAAQPSAAPRRVPQDFIHETAEIRYAPSPEIGRPAYGSSQSVILGVGY
ncbi:hypothetical protein [Methyloferula stellata]|uniref:hypothetical protein n=1 Tax=Methyloferula stellata TaxID=876270 RepID=UPI0003A9C411|nr:hypothetical protein [Methyloferula stellata]